MRAGYLREAVALLERAQQTDDPREASELVKQAADILRSPGEAHPRGTINRRCLHTFPNSRWTRRRPAGSQGPGVSATPLRLGKRTPHCGPPADLPHPRADRRARRCSALPASFLRLICEPHPVAGKTAAASYARVGIQLPDRDRVPMPSQTLAEND